MRGQDVNEGLNQNRFWFVRPLSESIDRTALLEKLTDANFVNK
jgi:hypothetical protein